MVKRIVVLVCALMLVTACASQQAVSPDDASRTAGVKKGGLEDDASRLGKDRIGSKELSDEELRREAARIFHDIHFDYNKYDVRGEDKSTLKDINEFMLAHTGVLILIEGHADERGTNEYNLALGDKRAQSAKNTLVSMGIPSGRIETISFGKERPLCHEHNDACWSTNRRAHFELSR